jgi:hypothetical protein
MADFPTAGLAIINPSSGAGPSLDNGDVQNYIKQVAALRKQVPGLIVLGYVYTDYANRSVNEDVPASGDRPFVRSVKNDVDAYYDWYGVDGIFFDEASTDLADVPYYKDIYLYVKSKTGTCGVVINPGTRTHPAYLDTADIIVNFEGYYSSYLSDENWEDRLPGGAEPDWEQAVPAYRFWHMVHTTPEAGMPNVIPLSRERHAGWVYVTDDVMDNPWDTLPPYWEDFVDRVASQP